MRQHNRSSEWESVRRGSKLYVDALNFSAEFGFTVAKWSVQHAQTCITRFVNATRQSSIEVAIFIDAGIGSEEGSEKWRNRRQADVRREHRGVPQGTNVLMGDIFRGLDVPVFYSGPKQDLDDCLASHATIDSANILSNDGDYFRYVGRNYVQYGKWKIAENGALLVQRKLENKKREAPGPRQLLKPKPVMLLDDPSLVTLESKKLYLRGVPSPLVKLCGNPHGKATSLRAALYAQRGVKGKVHEEWPIWDEKKKEVSWHRAETEPDSSGLCLFERTPEELFTQFFGKEVRPDVPDLEVWEWENHLFSCRAVVYELWLMGQKERGNVSLLSLLLPSMSDDLDDVAEKLQSTTLSDVELAPDSCDNFRSKGHCNFGASCFKVSGHKRCPYFLKGTCRRGENCLFYHGK